ncbi:MFS transporter [Acinetobacter lwoffii]|uniref:MFS transporter n=1 Tax=Acinetobacter lwoffii TaxID=28090 RepID=UPI0021CDCCED|nr:MFS transporter [Acinetobacter lwoffii]MCU4420914.1 MFS transporter [Acinetobacter lwoffii]
MPIIIYIFTITAFALGLAEFVPIGITDVMASGLGVSVEQTGSIVAAYALGATFAAPVLTALTNGWSRKKVMLVTTIIFTLGSLATAFASSLTLMIIARFVAGMGHGLFLAVASSTAAKLAGSARAGSAVAIVFGGFTIAMAIGVPLSTYLGGVIDWRLVLGFIALFGAVGFVGLLVGMKDPLHADQNTTFNAKQEILTIFNPKLISSALVTVFAYAGSFAAYTYIASMLIDVTKVSPSSVPMYTLLYGVFAAIGNVLGGKVTDSLGTNKANVVIVSGIILTAFGMWLFIGSPIMMAIMVSLLGLFTFGAVPALQARLIKVAYKYAPNSHGVAAGLNIAGFNSAIALGSILGGMTISHIGLSFTGITGAVLSVIGLLILVIQIQNSASQKA